MERPLMRYIGVATLLVAFGMTGGSSASAAEDRETLKENATATVVPTAVITIPSGKLRGAVEGDVHVFRGIPYAAPPIGNRRWKPPAPTARWDGVRDCFEFGPACPQSYSAFMNMVPLASIPKFDEDCLNLNVYRPAQSDSQTLPVMVWIHGGAYTEGASSQQIYDGRSLARKGVVVVTINYRLGPFGFLAHPALSRESPESTSGNYGIQDQIEALRWIQRNITAFGGDPGKVTIFGESAGGGSVGTLLVTPAAKGLFHRAIVQSAPEMSFRYLRSEYRGRESAEQVGVETIRRCGLDDDADPASMRELSVQTLLSASPTLKVLGQTLALSSLALPVEPNVDGVVLPEHPNDALAAGRFCHVPTLIGMTRDEGSLFLAFTKLPETAVEFRQLMNQEFGPFGPEICEQYLPQESSRAVRAAFVQLFTDWVYGTQCRHLASQVNQHTGKSFHYVFSRTPQFPVLAPLGAHHGADVPYVFGTDHPVWNWKDWDRKLADTMMQYWVNFASTGDPNGASVPTWPAYDDKQRISLQLGDEIVAINNFRQSALDLLDRFKQTYAE